MAWTVVNLVWTGLLVWGVQRTAQRANKYDVLVRELKRHRHASFLIESILREVGE